MNVSADLIIAPVYRKSRSVNHSVSLSLSKMVNHKMHQSVNQAITLSSIYYLKGVQKPAALPSLVSVLVNFVQSVNLEAVRSRSLTSHKVQDNTAIYGASYSLRWLCARSDLI